MKRPSRFPRPRAGSNSAQRPPDRKRKGEIAELCFAHRAAQLGLIVSKPYGDSAPYDFVVEGGGVLRRVQVKSASSPFHGSYRVGPTHGIDQCRLYTSEDIDVLAAYVVPEDTWYFFPIEEIAGTTSLYLCGPRRVHEFYRERWSVLGASAPVPVPARPRQPQHQDRR